jgi:3-oxoacyl-(acyl-carrier-protein) synthase
VNVLPRGDIIVSGIGAACDRADPSAFLRMRKMRKYMGRQDDLAVGAAGRALQSAGLGAPLGERCGLYLAVGYIPFERGDMDALIGASLEGGRFSMPRFASAGMLAINPLLTFRVLPNMPAFHVSLNFDIQGPYLVGYPGAGQFYVALDEAAAALDTDAIDVALDGAVADQRNVLVEHHMSRVDPPVPADRLADAAAFLVLERADGAAARAAPVRARLDRFELRYSPADPFGPTPASECLARDGVCIGDGRHFGPASLPVALAGAAGRLTHRVRTRDGFDAASAWEVVA